MLVSKEISKKFSEWIDSAMPKIKKSLGAFSLANHRQFAKTHNQTFPLSFPLNGSYIFKPGTRRPQVRPWFLIITFVRVCMRVCVCVCVYASEAINY